ncbi:hypothetical protein FHG87_020604 [Trinorchestia longiramus]|nr:hypothetical protein FHG87_020604 [Trinorchestia longiramus]
MIGSCRGIYSTDQFCSCSLNNNACEHGTKSRSNLCQESEELVSDDLSYFSNDVQHDLIYRSRLNNEELNSESIFLDDNYSDCFTGASDPVQPNNHTSDRSCSLETALNHAAAECNSNELDGGAPCTSSSLVTNEIEHDVTEGRLDGSKFSKLGDPSDEGAVSCTDVSASVCGSLPNTEKPTNVFMLSSISSFLKRQFLSRASNVEDIVLVSASPLADEDDQFCDVNQNSLVLGAHTVASCIKEPESFHCDDILSDTKKQIHSSYCNELTAASGNSSLVENLQLSNFQLVKEEASHTLPSEIPNNEANATSIDTTVKVPETQREISNTCLEDVEESWKTVETLLERNFSTLLSIAWKSHRSESSFGSYRDARNLIFSPTNDSSSENRLNLIDLKKLRRLSLPSFLSQGECFNKNLVRESSIHLPLRACRPLELRKHSFHCFEDHSDEQSITLQGNQGAKQPSFFLKFDDETKSNNFSCKLSASSPNFAEIFHPSGLFVRSSSVTSIVSTRNYSCFDSLQSSIMGNIQANEGKRNPKLKEKDRLKITKGKSSSRPSLLDSTDTLVETPEDKAAAGSVVPESTGANDNKEILISSCATASVKTRDNADPSGFVTDSFRKVKQKDSEKPDSALSNNRNSNSLSHKTSSSDSLFTEAPNSLTASIIKENKKVKQEDSTLSEIEVSSPTDSIERKFEAWNNTSLLEVLELTNNLPTASCLPSVTTSCLPFRSTQSRAYNSVSPSTGGSLENGSLRTTFTENALTKKQEISRGVYGGGFSGRESPPYHPHQVNNTGFSYSQKIGERVCASLDSCANSSKQPSSFESVSETLLDVSEISLSVGSKPDTVKEKLEASFNLNAAKELSRAETATKPKRFLPSVPSLSPPTSPVPKTPDHILEDGEHFYEVFIEDPVVQRQSRATKKSADHDRSSGLGPSLGDMPQASAGRIAGTTFRITRHKKVDLQPASAATTAGQCQYRPFRLSTNRRSTCSLRQQLLLQVSVITYRPSRLSSNRPAVYGSLLEQAGGAKSSSTSANNYCVDVNSNGGNATRDVVLDSNVLRKVACLTLEQAVADKKQKTPVLPRPKLPPEKLAFKNRHTFDGGCQDEHVSRALPEAFPDLTRPEASVFLVLLSPAGGRGAETRPWGSWSPITGLPE